MLVHVGGLAFAGRHGACTRPGHLANHVLPVVPIRQWVLSLPYLLRTMLGVVPRVFVRALSGWIRGKVRERGRADRRA